MYEFYLTEAVKDEACSHFLLLYIFISKIRASYFTKTLILEKPESTTNLRKIKKSRVGRWLDFGGLLFVLCFLVAEMKLQLSRYKAEINTFTNNYSKRYIQTCPLQSSELQVLYQLECDF